MLWIKVSEALANDARIAQLGASMGWSEYETLGRLNHFWLWVLRFYEDGILENAHPAQIARAFGAVGGEGERFVEMLVECHLLDENPRRVRNWLQDFAWSYLVSKLHDSNPGRLKEIARRYGKKSFRMTPRCPSGHPSRHPEGPPQDDLPSQSTSPSTSTSLSQSQSRSGSKREKRIGNGKRARRSGEADAENSASVPIEERIKNLHQAFENTGFTQCLHDAFPDINLDVERKRMAVWIRANPLKSNKQNWERFVNNWCAQEQARLSERREKTMSSEELEEQREREERRRKLRERSQPI